MIFCCFPIPASYAPLESTKYMVTKSKNAHQSLVTSPTGGSTQPTSTPSSSSWGSMVGEYPGMRRQVVLSPTLSFDKHAAVDDCIRLIPTFGNARREYDSTQDDLVSVTVPPDTFPGQVIGVIHPNLSGRMAATAVPQGLAPGDTFTVCFPAANASQHSQCTSPIPWSAAEGGIPTTTGRLATTTKWEGANTMEIDHELALRESIDETRADPSSTAKEEEKEETRPLNSENNVVSPAPSPLSLSTPRLLLVNVPQGATAGSRLHVAVPNEPGRILEAVVPPGDVEQFHVSYQPQQTPQEAQSRSTFNIEGAPTNSTVRANSGPDNRAGYAAPMIFLPGFL